MSQNGRGVDELAAAFGACRNLDRIDQRLAVGLYPELWPPAPCVAAWAARVNSRA